MSAGTAVAFPIVVDATSCVYSCFVLVFTNFFKFTSINIIHFYIRISRNHLKKDTVITFSDNNCVLF